MTRPAHPHPPPTPSPHPPAPSQTPPGSIFLPPPATPPYPLPLLRNASVHPPSSIPRAGSPVPARSRNVPAPAHTPPSHLPEARAGKGASRWTSLFIVPTDHVLPPCSPPPPNCLSGNGGRSRTGLPELHLLAPPMSCGGSQRHTKHVSFIRLLRREMALILCAQDFRNPDDPDDKSFEVESCPTADLEYPNNYANEKCALHPPFVCALTVFMSSAPHRFMLLAPKDKDHYNPIMCLEQSLYTIVDCLYSFSSLTVFVNNLPVYLSPAQKALFGSLPTESLSDDTPPPSPSQLTRPDPSDPSNPPPEPPNPLQPHNNPRPDYLRLLQRAIRRHNGPLFLSTLEIINQLLRSLKYPPLPSDVFLPAPPNVLTSAVRSWTHPKGIPEKVLLRIVDETYQRCVGPNIKNLHRYEAFSSEVYGELMPSFTSDIITTTGLNSSSLLMDLGSGVGNVLLQASLQTGCRSYGIELLEGPADVARQQWVQFQKRCRMWGVRPGDVELEEGDMLRSKRVSELLGEADVVLVNNKVFQQSRECPIVSHSWIPRLRDMLPLNCS